jgi:hypothetical protein
MNWVLIPDYGHTECIIQFSCGIGGQLLQDLMGIYITRSNFLDKIAKQKAYINCKRKGDLRKKTSRALNTCSGAIVRFSSLLQISFDSDDIKFMNSATQSESILYISSDMWGNQRKEKKNQEA